MDDGLLKEFINESREHLATIEVDLLAIEEGGADIDEELVNKVFRAAHSIKGGSGFFGLAKVKELSHRAETVLDMLRSRKMAPNAEIINVLLAAFDRLREMINDSTNSESTHIDDLVVSLTGLASSFLPGEQKAILTRDVVLQSPAGWTVVVPEIDVDRARRGGRFIYGIEYDLIHDVDRQGKNVLQMFRDLETTGEILECAIGFDEAGTLDGPLGNTLPLRLVHATVIDPDMASGLFEVAADKISVLYNPRTAAHPPAIQAAAPPRVEAVQAPVAQPAPAPPVSAPAPPQPPAARVASAKADAQQSDGLRGGDETLRVSVGLLETLMNLAGELVLSRNQLRTAIATRNVQSLSVADQRLSHVTSEIQDVIMQTRLQPIGNVFGKFPRVVRDMAAALKKDIQLDIRGKDVALDRSLIEGLSDPLTHMVRNSVDHGIELPEERQASGKRPQGTVRIEARHEAGQVVVEIADDGKGIDPKRVAESAVKKGLIAAEKVAAMSDEDKVALVFLPGLSTAETVTDISGRGVGMDVVKTNLDRLGGKVEIKSIIGKGTTFRIKLPLTLAIIPSLIVSVESERFAIPQVNVEELLRIRAEDVKKRIEVVGDAEVLLLRDKIIPLVRFDRVLGGTPTYLDPSTGGREIDRRVAIADRRSPRHPVDADAPDVGAAKAAPRSSSRGGPDRRTSPASALEIAVVTTGTMTYGLVVDEFHDTEEIVVKPLGRHLQHLREYAGATILGDGHVALILDVAGTAVKADLASVSGSARAAAQAETADKERLEDTHSLLLFHNGQDEICAVPLDVVERIERISASQVELAGNRRTMQYRGASLPLVTLSDVASVQPVDSSNDLAVIVSRVHGHEVGLLGAMPVDVVDTKALVDQVTHRQTGIAGSAIIRDKTTLITDIREVVNAVHPEWVQERAAERMAALPAATQPEALASVGVLLAEDSDFFRAQVKRYLEEDGYTVFAAPDGEAAWEALLAHLGEVKLVVTDLEMPRLTGFGLAQRIRADERTAKLPIIAVTSLAGEDDVAKGKAVGIDEYQVKLDRDRLMERVHAFAATAA